ARLLAVPSALRSPCCRLPINREEARSKRGTPSRGAGEPPGAPILTAVRRAPQLIRQGHHSGQAISTDTPTGVPLSREVFEQDGVSRAEPAGGPIADHDLHLASGKENRVLAARRIVPIAETAVGRTREGDTAGGLLD